MDIGYAIIYIFDDRKWVGKLALLAVVTLTGVLLTPLLIGLPALIVALGYTMQIAGNVRQGLPRPLPEWKEWGAKFTLGTHVLLAMLLYNLPLALIGLCSWILIGGLSSGFIGGGITFFTVCCALPFGLLYTLVSWFMLATGMAEFMETGETRAIYRFIHLWDVMQANRRVLFRWGLYATLVNVVLIFLMIIPCIGWLAAALFGFPVHAHLLGQFAHQLSLKSKPLSKKAPRPQPR